MERSAAAAAAAGWGTWRTREFPALLGAILLVGVAGNLSIHLLGIALQQRGTSAVLIGLSTALQALGIVLAACCTPWLLRRVGTARLALWGCTMAGLAFLACGAVEDVAAVTALRVAFAVGHGVVFTVAEYVLLARTAARRRSTAIAAYATAFAIGAALAPAVVGLLGPDHPANYLVGAGCLLGAAALVGAVRMRGRVEPIAPASFGAIARAAPLALLAALMFGLLDNGLLSFLSLFALETGASVPDASWLAAAAFFGIVVLQLPLGWLGDRFDPGAVLLTCAVLALAVLVALPQVVGVRPALFVMAFLLGGLCDAFYVLGLAMLGRQVAPARLATANACFIACCGLGEVAGPLVAGGALGWSPGAFLWVFVVLIAVACFALNRGARPGVAAAPAARADGAPA